MDKLKNIWQWIKRHSLLLKIIFFGSVLIFVANQFAGIMQGMSFAEIEETMASLPIYKIILMFATGLFASTLLISYDAVVQHSLEKQGQTPFKKREWLPLAFMINSLNNLVGFGGIIGATLRGNFYQKNLPKGKVLATVSKMAFFMLTGLSVLSLFSFGALFIFPVDDYFRQYWFWLLGGGLYAPALLIFAHLKKKSLFAEFFPRGVWALVGASVLQWAGAAFSFMVIGLLLNLQFSLAELLPMFFATSLIGMLTMVPGGAGTFDVLMILGLGQMGISREVALLWLLYYRLAYYIVPFILGGGLFIHHTGVKINHFFDGLPQILGQKAAHFILTAAVYFAGIMMILLSTVTNLSNVSAFFNFLLPFSFDFLDQTLNILVGILLLGLARGVAAKVRKAYLPTLLVLGFGILNTIIKTRDLRLIIVYFLILVAVYVSRKEFFREKLVYSFGAFSFDALLLTVLLILYSIAGLYAQKDFTGDFFSGWFILFPSATVWFRGLLGLGLAIIVLVTLMTYLMQGEDPWEKSTDIADDFILRYGTTLDLAEIRQEKRRGYSYVVNNEAKVYFSFERRVNKLFVFGNPFGPEKLWSQAVIRFMKRADDLGFQLAFYCVTPEFVSCLHDLGFDYVKIGELGHVTEFTAQKKNTAFRQIRFENILPAEKQAWQEQLAQEVTIQLTTPFELLFAKEKIVGLITEASVNGEKVILESWATDANAYQVLLENYLAEQSDHQQPVNLGFLPLKNVGDSRFSYLTERLVHVIYHYGLKNAQWSQQSQMKEQFATKAENRYVAFRKNANGVITLYQLFSLLKKATPVPYVSMETLLQEDAPEDIL